MCDNGTLKKEDVSPRKIHIETRFGRARRSRSRKDRPCDACRHRKSACVITVRPPCRYCESKGQDCTFASAPKQRVRKAPTTIKPKGLNTEVVEIVPSNGASEIANASPGGAFANMQHSTLSVAQVDTYHRDISIYPTPNRMVAGPLSGPLSLPAPVLYNAYPLTLRPQENPTLHHAHHSFGRVQYRTERSIPSGNGFSDLQGLVETLDDVKGLTAHSLGPSSDQDANLLSSFRSNILNETSYVDVNIRQVFAGSSENNAPPVHFNIVHDLFPDRDNRAKEIASDNIEAHVGPHGDSLVRLYFHFVHPAFPILSKARFLKAYCQNRLSIPASLRGVIYGLACPFWAQDEALRPLVPISQAELFEQAHAALNRELDSPKLSTLQACLLVLHETPPLTGTTESPRTWTFACQATSCAQSLGLHQDPSLWNIPAWEKSIRKKMWWAAFVTDKWSSLGHGNPSHIPESSFDTTDLTLKDLLVDEDVLDLPYGRILLESDRGPNHARAVNFLETVKLAKLLSTLLDYVYIVRDQSMLPPTASGVIDQSLYMFKTEMESWYSMLPQCLTMDFATGIGDTCTNGPLHLAFFAVKSLLFRAIMSPATPLSKSNPFSNLRTHFDPALEEFKYFVKLISSIQPADLAAFWGRHARTHLVHTGNFLIYLFLCASTAEQVEKSYALLERYRHALRYLAEVADDTSMAMIRPALLRTESFFKEAIEIMRKGGVRN